MSIEEMRVLQQMYDGDIVVPLPELNSREMERLPDMYRIKRTDECDDE